MDFEEFEELEKCPNQIVDTDGTNQTIFDMVHDWPKLYNSIKNCEDVCIFIYVFHFA